jgi:hypothetical protein
MKAKEKKIYSSVFFFHFHTCHSVNLNNLQIVIYQLMHGSTIMYFPLN